MNEQEPVKWAKLTPEQRDELVAEKVMGWQETICESHVIDCGGGWQCSTCGLSGGWSDYGDRFFEHKTLPPRYSQSMDAAWLIVEKMKKSDTLVELSDELENLLHVKSLFNVLWYITPDAICLAALRACGVKIEEK